MKNFSQSTFFLGMIWVLQVDMYLLASIFFPKISDEKSFGPSDLEKRRINLSRDPLPMSNHPRRAPSRPRTFFVTAVTVLAVVVCYWQSIVVVVQAAASIEEEERLSPQPRPSWNSVPLPSIAAEGDDSTTDPSPPPWRRDAHGFRGMGIGVNGSVAFDAGLGTWEIVAGVVAAPASDVDGNAAVARFNAPMSLAVLPNGDVAVGEEFAGGLRLLSIEGPGGAQVSTPIASTAPSTPESSTIVKPIRGMVFCPNSGAIFAVTSGHTLRKLTPPAVVGSAWQMSTVAGVDGASGYADGAGNVARFNNPTCS